MKRIIRFTTACAALAAATVLTVPVLGQGNGNVDGAIFTTTGDGSVVNENTRYGAKSEVYLNGGPQNHNANGLPDGEYYFQITDPSGAVLLSEDDIECRRLVVAGGRVAGVPGGAPAASCAAGVFHNIGTYNGANGSTPVQMIPFADTPNPGGEYKAWITPVSDFDHENNGPDSVCRGGQDDSCHGFFDRHSKTDNFKVRDRNPNSQYADVTVCKFSDLNGDGTQSVDEPLIPHWPITATGVELGVVTSQTGDDGCVTFTYSDFVADGVSTATITLTEGTFGPDWSQTAPADGEYGAFSASGGVITVAVAPFDELMAPSFGNHNPYCLEGCVTDRLVVSKTAYPSLTRTFTWGIEKNVDATEIKAAAGTDVTFNYTVSVTHDAGTDSAWKVSGTITVSNPGPTPVTADVTDATNNGGVCEVANGAGVVIAAGSHLDLNYTCAFYGPPADGVNTATATDTTSGQPFSGTASIDFDSATVAVLDDTVAVTDTVAGPLGVVSSADPSPVTFTYSTVVTAPAGTCVEVPNTAKFTADDTGAEGWHDRSVTVCGAVDLQVSKTASAAFASEIDKATAKTLFQIKGGSATLTYTVTVTTSGWTVSGDITVVNANDWQAITADVTDAVGGGGTCAVAGGAGLVVGPSSAATVPYSCTYASAPTAASGTNTATATWERAAAYTANGSAVGTADYGFGSLTVSDAFNAGTPHTLGTVAGNAASTTFTDVHTVAAPAGGRCAAFDNTAAIVETGDTDSQSVTVCNTAAGGLTIGFWQNRNGQNVIKAANQDALRAFLTQYAPFQDLGTQVIATYVTNVVKAASAATSSMNAMLKAQMLATALSVNFSTTGLGGVSIDLANVCTDLSCTAYENSSPVFGGTPKTVSEMLAAAAANSNVGGSLWYANDKSTQELAKDTFDVINNQLAWIAP